MEGAEGRGTRDRGACFCHQSQTPGARPGRTPSRGVTLTGVPAKGPRGAGPTERAAWPGRPLLAARGTAPGPGAPSGPAGPQPAGPRVGPATRVPRRVAPIWSVPVFGGKHRVEKFSFESRRRSSTTWLQLNFKTPSFSQKLYLRLAVSEVPGRPLSSGGRQPGSAWLVALVAQLQVAAQVWTRGRLSDLATLGRVRPASLTGSRAVLLAGVPL